MRVENRAEAHDNNHASYLIISYPMIQIKREMAVEDLERMQISMGIAEGRSPQDLAQIGLTSAVDPKVLI